MAMKASIFSTKNIKFIKHPLLPGGFGPACFFLHHRHHHLNREVFIKIFRQSPYKKMYLIPAKYCKQFLLQFLLSFHDGAAIHSRMRIGTFFSRPLS